MFEPRIVKDALENKDWVNKMNKEIEKIENNNTWALVLRPKDKNVIEQNGFLGTSWMRKKKW